MQAKNPNAKRYKKPWVALCVECGAQCLQASTKVIARQKVYGECRNKGNRFWKRDFCRIKSKKVGV